MPRALDPNEPVAVGPKAARDRFTNRVDETRRFLELLNAPEGSPLPLLMFYGVGGAGKTSLLDHLQGRCEEWRVPWAAVNLAEAGEADAALPKLANDLKRRHGVRFPRLERALAVLIAREVGEVLARTLGDPGKAVDKALRSVGFASEAKRVATGLRLDHLVPELLRDSLAAVEEIVPVVRFGRNVAQLAFDKAMELEPFRDAVLRLGGQAELIPLFRLSDDELRAELERAFAADLAAGLPARPGPGGRGALFFDTHEALWRDGKGGASPHDAWLRRLRQFVHGRGVLVVIAGRDSLRWPEDWHEEDGLGRRVWLEEHRMGGLSERDALEFLHRSDAAGWPDAPFEMPAPLRGAILRATNERPEGGPGAHHCYLLALAAEIVANTREASGAYPAPELFDSVSRRDAGGALVARFLTSLPGQAMVGWLEELSLTPRFDEAFALALDAARHHHNGRAGWNRLRQLSLLEEREGGFLEMHKLLREALRIRVPPEDASAVHAWAHGHWASLAGEEDWARRGLAWYHHRLVGHRAALDEFTALNDRVLRQAQAQALRRLVEWWADVSFADAASGSDRGQDLLTYGKILWEVQAGDRAANLTKAITCYEAALQAFDEGGFSYGWAKAHNNLGTAYCELPTGDRAENLSRAIEHFTAALRVYTETDFPSDWSAIQSNLGGVYCELPTGDRAENLTRAIGYFTAALRVDTEADFPRNWAMTQINLGVAYLYLPTGNRAENLSRAIEHSTAALRVFTEADFPYYWAMTHVNLGEAYGEHPTGDGAVDLPRAIERYTAALRVYTEEDFPYYWALGQNGLGQALAKAGDAARAKEAFTASARGFRAANLEDQAREVEGRRDAS